VTAAGDGPAGGAYVGREQTWVKHYVLRNYLQLLALKVGQHAPGTTLNFIDGFSGPWKAVSEDHLDTSPAIAMTELSRVCDALQARPAPVQMTARCMFVEQDRGAFEQLTSLCAKWPTLKTETHCGRFEDHIADAVLFASAGHRPFAFAFIDPTGWTGYALAAITPLLRVTPGEVLINFMLKDISRFIDDGTSGTVASFEGLFGQDAEKYRATWRGLAGLDREDAIVQAYRERIRAEGRFSYCVSTVVLHPQVDRTHFHLVYATRSRRGLVAFREIERRAMREQRSVRATAKQATRAAFQPALFAAEVLDTPYVEELATRYADRARNAVIEALGRTERMTYEHLVDQALLWPMVSETDLKVWLSEWCASGRVALHGLTGRERTPKLGAGHTVSLVVPGRSR